MAEGWRIVADAPRAPEELVARFRGLGTGPICDALGRFGAMDWRIKPLGPGMRMAGSALTVRTRPCDNIAVYKALEMTQPGDVLVVTTHEFTTASVFGDLVVLLAARRGVAGMVTDGVVRDLEGILEVGLPVFARGCSPNSPYKDGPAEINVPIACGGVLVRPGDIVVGDADGVAVVPLERAEEVLAQVAAIAEKERAVRAEIETGSLPRAVARRLRELGL
ncbi:MAG: RraA family protein [Anaerolineae bacterium]|nr:RraA family protein [Anaerolineae bacterium]